MSIFSTIREMAAQLKALSEKVDQLSGRADSSALAEAVTALTDKVDRHDLAIGDLVDTLEDQQTAAAQAQEQLLQALEESASAQVEPLRAENQQLLRLAISTRDHLAVMSRAAESDPAWRAQFAVAERMLVRDEAACGLERIGECGARVVTALMEVTEIRATADRALDLTVAEVYQDGWRYQGRLVRKAQVAVWRYEAPDGAENN